MKWNIWWNEWWRCRPISWTCRGAQWVGSRGGLWMICEYQPDREPHAVPSTCRSPNQSFHMYYVEIRWGYFGNSVRPLSSRIILECSRDERGQVTITLNLSFYIYLVARKTVWLPRVVGSVQIMHREVVRKQSRLYGMQGAFTMY